MRGVAVAFPDVASHVCERLEGLLRDRPEASAQKVVVAQVTPTTRPARLVTVRRDGGPRLDLSRELARLGVNVYAQNDREVGQLTSLVRALIESLADGDPICRVGEASGPIDVSAPSGQARRYFSVELVVRGQQL